MTIGFFFIPSRPSQAPGAVVFPLPGIQVVRGDDSDLFAMLTSTTASSGPESVSL
jgi:hypothetical protein